MPKVGQNKITSFQSTETRMTHFKQKKGEPYGSPFSYKNINFI